MKQQSLGLNPNTRRTRRAVFLDQMNLVVHWGELVGLISQHAPVAKTGRPAFAHRTFHKPDGLLAKNRTTYWFPTLLILLLK